MTENFGKVACQRSSFDTRLGSNSPYSNKINSSRIQKQFRPKNGSLWARKVGILDRLESVIYRPGKTGVSGQPKH
jgi:hypothetical protein